MMTTDVLPAYRALKQIEEAESRSFDGDEDEALWLLADLYPLHYRAVEHYVSTRNGARGVRDAQENHGVFTDVMMRACVLAWQLGDTDQARDWYARVIVWATDPVRGDAVRYKKAQETWKRLTTPWWRSWLLACTAFLASIGTYEINKKDTKYDI